MTDLEQLTAMLTRAGIDTDHRTDRVYVSKGKRERRQFLSIGWNIEATFDADGKLLDVEWFE